MQFNMYHHYTVDEHLIRAVGNVAAIERGELKNEHPLATDIIKRIKSREALYCAILLHDIAKGLARRSFRCRRGDRRKPVPAARPFARQTPHAVAWLVRNHLVMSDTAQRRDISDPKTVRDFVDVGAIARDAAPAAGADRRRYPRRRTRRVERLEGPASARALLRSRKPSCRAAMRRRRARRASSDAKEALAERLADLPPERANARCRAITTLIGSPSTTRRMSAMPA